MGRIVTIPDYLNWNVNEVSIGDVVSLGNRQYEFSRVDILDIRSVLQAASADVVALCNHANINPYSLFRPKNNNIPVELNGPRDMTLFAGYNHNAMPCVRYSTRSGSATKQYDSSSGDAKFPVQLSLLIGERYPLHSGSNSSWGEIAVKVTIGTETQWVTLSLPNENYISLWFHTSNYDAETVHAQITAFYTDPGTDPEQIHLTGYKDGHYYGIAIEDGVISDFAISLSAIDPSLYATFTANASWDGVHKYVSIVNQDPSGYTYTYTWSASQGSIMADHGSWLEVSLVNDGGTPNCGAFSCIVTASYSGMISTSQTFDIVIRNNVISQL